MQFSKQLITELTQNLSPEIIVFYDKNMVLNEYRPKSLNLAVEQALEKYYGSNLNEQELRKTVSNINYNRYVKRRRWYSDLEAKSKKYEISDKRNPFYYMYQFQVQLDDESWMRLIDGGSIETYIQKELARAKVWKENKDSLFIQFSTIGSMNKKIVANAFISDIAVDLYKIINVRYQGSLQSVFRSYPEDLIGLPMFMPGRSVGMNMTDNEHGEYEEVLMDEDGVSSASVTISKTDLQSIKRDYRIGELEMMSTMNQNSLLVLNYLISCITHDFYYDKKIIVEINRVAKLLCPNKRISSFYYALANRICLQLGTLRFVGYNQISETGGLINIIDNVVLMEDDDGKKIAVVTAGEFLFDQIINRKLITVMSSHMDSLSDLSKILYFTLEKERIRLYSHQLKNGGDENCLKRAYPYTFFQRNVRFRRMDKKYNMIALMRSLYEFKEKQITIKDVISYETSTSMIEITYRPLSDEEKFDLQTKANLTFALGTSDMGVIGIE